MAIVAVRENDRQGLHLAHSGASSLLIGERIQDLEGGEVRRMGAAPAAITKNAKNRCNKLKTG
jgi:hypothetical protein